MADEIKKTIVIESDTSKIQRGLKDLEANFKTSFSNIQSVANSALGALGVGLGVGALIGFAKEVVNTAGVLDDLSQKTGISAQALSALKPIAEQNSSSIEDFANSMVKLIRGLADSSAAGDKARRTLQEIGVTAAQIRQFTAEPEKAIGVIAEKLAAVENPAKRASVAFDIMGKAGANQIPTLLKIAEIVKQLGGFDKIKLQGIDDATIRSLKQLDDSLNSIKNTLIRIAALPLSELAKFLRAIGLGGGPSNQDQVESLNRRLEALQKSAANQIAHLPKEQQATFNTATPNLAAVPPGLKNTFDQIAALTKERDAIQGVTDALNTPAKPIDPVSDQSIKKLANFREQLQKLLDAAGTERTTLLLGPQAGEAAKLDALFKEARQQFVDAKLPIPANLGAVFEDMKAKILGERCQ